MMVAVLCAPAFLWAFSANSDDSKYSKLNEIDYASDYYTSESGFIAESHLTRTSNISEGEFTERNIFQTKVLNTVELIEGNNLSTILEDYK
jgi:hypothetical protein